MFLQFVFTAFVFNHLCIWIWQNEVKIYFFVCFSFRFFLSVFYYVSFIVSLAKLVVRHIFVCFWVCFSNYMQMSPPPEISKLVDEPITVRCSFILCWINPCENQNNDQKSVTTVARGCQIETLLERGVARTWARNIRWVRTENERIGSQCSSPAPQLQPVSAYISESWTNTQQQK